MAVVFFLGFILVLAVPLVLCLNAMGRQIRADFERGEPDRIATDVNIQRVILLTVGGIVAVSSILGHWMVGLTVLLTGLAFLIPYWRNRPVNIADHPSVD